MPKKELFNRLLITLIWLLVISLFRWHWHWHLIWLWLGSFLGIFLIELDHFLYVLLSNPHELTGLRIKRLLEQRSFREILTLVVDTRGERERLAFHNALFQVVLYALCFFTISSTNNLFGSGLLMGMALILLRDELDDLLKGKEGRLRNWLFWPLRQTVSLPQQRLFIIAVVILFLVLSFLLV